MKPSTAGFVAVPGGRVWYELHGGGPGLPLLTAHGGPGVSHEDLEGLLDLCPDRPVVFYDQLGAGKSDAPDDVGLWTLPRYVEEMECVRAALGFERFHVLGQSWGTILALEYTLARQQRVAGLVLASPYASMRRHRLDQARLLAALPAGLRASIERLIDARAFQSREFRAAIKQVHALHYCRRQPWPEPLLRSVQTYNDSILQVMWGPNWLHTEGTLKGFERAERLPELQMPVLFTCGRFDEVSEQTVDRYCGLTAHASKAVFESSGHMGHVEEPERFAAAVGAFLREADATGARHPP